MARVLNYNPETKVQVGPIVWDVSGSDWECWLDDVEPQTCAERYFHLIEQLGRGIVLLHDSSPKEELIQKNRAVELTTIGVDLLQRSNYKFVRLDEVPQVNSGCHPVYGIVKECLAHAASAVELTVSNIHCDLRKRFAQRSRIPRIARSLVGRLASAMIPRLYFVALERIRRIVRHTYKCLVG